MMVNGGELDGVRILAPASIELMGTNQIPQSAMVPSTGNLASLFTRSRGFPKRQSPVLVELSETREATARLP
jgi:hypothetical protein